MNRVARRALLEAMDLRRTLPDSQAARDMSDALEICAAEIATLEAALAEAAAHLDDASKGAPLSTSRLAAEIARKRIAASAAPESVEVSP